MALAACSIAPILLLLKPSCTSKSKDHTIHLRSRLDLCSKCDLCALLSEGRCIQKHLGTGTWRTDNDAIARTFRDLILNGKVRDALHFLSRNTNGVDDLIPEKAEDGETEMRSVREILKDKHPKAISPPSCTLLDDNDPPYPVNSILFDELSSETILQCAMHTQGSAGPQV